MHLYNLLIGGKLMINFNVPPLLGTEFGYVKSAIENHKICGDGQYTKKCQEIIENRFHIQKCLMTTSGTAALEMAAILSGVKAGDEVILPSYTFTSTANAFVLCGAQLVFVDIKKDTMNIDENIIEKAITPKTKVICVVHYAGVSCNMDKIMELAHKHGLLVIEDAAQAVMSKYKDQALGTIADFGCFSFHETKNYSMGEGGALLIKDSKYNIQAEILREKGTDRSAFLRGQVDKYTWRNYGSSYLPSELCTAYLYGQLIDADIINNNRLRSWECYYKELSELMIDGFIDLPVIPKDCKHNAHMFYIKAKNIEERTKLSAYLKSKDVICAFHYIPLHSAPAGIKFGRFFDEDKFTTQESERLLRLPMYYGLKEAEIKYISDEIKHFYKNLNKEK